jgi:hypothetical protein
VRDTVYPRRKLPRRIEIREVLIGFDEHILKKIIRLIPIADQVREIERELALIPKHDQLESDDLSVPHPHHDRLIAFRFPDWNRNLLDHTFFDNTPSIHLLTACPA